MTKLVCSVDTCAHNSDHYCCKGKIQIEGERAEMASSTCCASFDEKKQGCKNSTEIPDEALDVCTIKTKCVMPVKSVLQAAVPEKWIRPNVQHSGWNRVLE